MRLEGHELRLSTDLDRVIRDICEGFIQAFAWKHWERHSKSSDRVASNPVEIRTGYLRSASPELTSTIVCLVSWELGQYGTAVDFLEMRVFVCVYVRACVCVRAHARACTGLSSNIGPSFRSGNFTNFTHSQTKYDDFEIFKL